MSDLGKKNGGKPVRYFVFMGVSGAGKSTVAEAVAAAIAGTFIEADALHPPANVKAMAAGRPLTDADRWPWLVAVCEAARASDPDRPVTIACSALAERYRDFIRERLGDVIFIHLRGPAEVIRARMARRTTHFMPAAMLDSQIAALEETADEGDCHSLDIDGAAEAIIAEATAICRRHAAGCEKAPTAPIESEARKTCTKGGQTMFRTAAKLSIAAVAVTLIAGTAMAQNYTFKFQSSDPAGNPNFVLQQEWAKNVGEMTGGQITINLLPVDSIVGHAETQDAIAAGILDGHITDVSYFSGKDPAFGLIANPVGAWSDPHTMLDFMRNGGGGKLMQELDGEYGLHFIGATTPGLEALVSKVPLDGVADLKGLKIRAPEGLVANVFAAAGAAPVNLPGSEVYTALDKGVIDAADYTVFSTNQAQGLNDIAPNPVYPGFHSLPLVEIAISSKDWDMLSPDLQDKLTQSVQQFADHELEVLQKRDEEAAAAAKAGGKIHIHDWSKEERAKFTTIAQGEWQKVATQSDNAQKVFDVLTKYLKDNGLMN